MKKNHTLVTLSCVLTDAWFWDLENLIMRSQNQNLENYGTSEGAVSHNVFYYQQLSIAGYQVSFCAYKYFE